MYGYLSIYTRLDYVYDSVCINVLNGVHADTNRLKAKWLYWEEDTGEDLPVEEDQPHPDVYVV